MGYLVCFIFLFNGCSDSKSGKPSSFLSVLGLARDNNASSSSTVYPPYGSQSPGSTPSNAGVPVSHSAPLKLSEMHQVNPNVIDLFGIFYHKNPNFPEVRQITDVSIVKFNDSLKQSGQEDWDFNQLILDAKMGNIIFTRGLQEFDYFSDSEFQNAKQIVALPNGSIHILSANNSIRSCWTFTGSQIVRNANCVSITNFSPRKIIAYRKDSLLSFDSNDSIYLINTLNNTTELLNFRYVFNNIVNISANENVILIIHKNGYSVSAYLDTGVGNDSRFEEKASNNTLRFSFDGDENSLTDKFKISEIVRNYEGRYFAYTPDFHKIINLDPYLKPTNAYWSFFPKPIPFVRVKAVNGLRMYPNSRLLYIFDAYSLNCFSEIDYEFRVDLYRYVPESILKVFQKFDSSINIENIDPKQNIFKLPGVEQVLNTERAKFL
jgi:hypothetical protein